MATKTLTSTSKLIREIGNKCIAMVLHSPFHGLLSRSMLLISFAGRRSYKPYTLPVSYARDGESIVIISQANRIWWRNLRGGAPVCVRLRGKDLAGYAESFESPTVVAAGLLALLRQSPAFRRHVGIALTPDGQPDRPDDLARLARGRVCVRVSDLVAMPALEV